ncbi:MAG TPA: VWA domain-containing protein [Pyrinomonadaceae bacterium]|jgi:Ca-activated chloride channel family protein|nr:VWA domain-containing protein [Pyrinomonadaceae bacterium]
MKKAARLLLIQSVLVFLALSVPVAVPAQNDDDIIKVDSNLVVLNASVLDGKGLPMLGLRQKSFHIFEDGVEQNIEFFESEETSFAAVILIDTSGSMEERILPARSAAITFLGGIRKDDVAAIYNFDSDVKLIQDFSQSRDVAEGVYDLKAHGMTVLNDAIVKGAQELAKRGEKRKAIIIISDGMDTKSRYSGDKALKAALAASTTVYTVDMSLPFAAADQENQRRLSIQQLKKFAEKSGGKFISTPGGTGLREAFKSIVTEMGNLYTLGYQPTNTATDGKYRAIELKVSDPKAQVRTRKGYNAVKK